MKRTVKSLAQSFYSLAFAGLVAGHVVRAPQAQCDVSSAYSALSSTSIGSSFCSSFLYPQGPSTMITTIVPTISKPCNTVTKTETDHFTETDVFIISTTLPSVTVSLYSTTKLVPSGKYTANKREAQAGTSSTSTSPPTSTSKATAAALSASTTAAAVAASPAAISAAGNHQCSSTPSQLCNCPSQTISDACSSLVTSPVPVISTVTATSTVTVKCSKSDVTVTTYIISTTFVGTYTMTIYPAPVFVSETGKLIATVPAACAASPYVGPAAGDPTRNGEPGDTFFETVYPYFPQTAVECCELCYDPVAAPNCIASAFLSDGAGGGFCELLVKANATAGEQTSPQCPIGIENYPFGQHAKTGIYPGPCAY